MTYWSFSLCCIVSANAQFHVADTGKPIQISLGAFDTVDWATEGASVPFIIKDSVQAQEKTEM